MSGERDSSTFSFVAAMAACAVSAGLIVIIATVLAVDALRSPAQPNLNPSLYLLFGGTLAGILVAAATAWWLLDPIESAYRRGGLAMVCAFATILVMLVCIPIHQLWGRPGLLALLVVCSVAAVLLWRQARRSRVRA